MMMVLKDGEMMAVVVVVVVKGVARGDSKNYIVKRKR